MLIASKKSGSNNHLNINENTKIVVVYFKTGFLFENDKNTVYNIQNNHKYNGALVTGNDFKIILEKYKGINYLLDSYLYNLCENLEKENHYVKASFLRLKNIFVDLKKES